MTSTPAILPVIDYTSRDYLALRADMIRLIQSRVPSWSANDPNDFGVALVEAFAYGIDTLHYYLDRVANEAYLSTATQRDSLYALASMFNYSPRPAQAASVELSFGNDSTHDIVVPDGARFQATMPVSGGGVVVKSFEVDLGSVGLTVPANTPANSLTPGAVALATEGRTYSNESVGVSNGFMFQTYILPRLSVLQNTIIITTTLGSVTTTWTAADTLVDANAESLVFVVESQTDGSTTIGFGDSVNGSIPPLHSLIQVTYRSGGGASGNVPMNSILVVAEPAIPHLLVNNRSNAIGGIDAESLDSIRSNTALSFRLRDRAVTLPDYVALSVMHGGITKAIGQSNNNASVTIYAAPDDDGTGTPVLTTEAADDLSLYLENLAMAGTTVTVAGPNYVKFFLTMTAYVNANARRSTVEASIRAALASAFSFNSLGFNYRLSVSEIIPMLMPMAGLSYVTISGLNIDDSAKLETLIFEDFSGNSYPYYQPLNIGTSLHLTLMGGLGV